MLKTIFTFITALFILASTGVPNVFAAEVPEFPECSNPQGTQKVSYDQGTHGIVGDTNEYTGSDVVYSLEDGNNLQCFCSEKGNGIQTNWWKASSLSQDEINELLTDNWILVPNGANWGLDEGQYLAKNKEYSCRSGSGGDTTSGDDSSNGQTLSSSTSNPQVLGLANTGNLVTIYMYAGLGLLSLFTGLVINKKFN